MAFRNLPGIALGVILLLGGACVTSRTNNQAPAAPQPSAPRVATQADDEAAQMRRKYVLLEERLRAAERDAATAKAAAQSAQTTANQAHAKPAPAPVVVKPKGYDPRQVARDEYSKNQYNVSENKKIDARLGDERRANLMAMMRNAGIIQAKSTVTRIDEKTKIVWEDWCMTYGGEWTLKFSIPENGALICFCYYRTPEAGTDDSAIIAELEGEDGRKPTDNEKCGYGFKKDRQAIGPTCIPNGNKGAEKFEDLISMMIKDFKERANEKHSK